MKSPFFIALLFFSFLIVSCSTETKKIEPTVASETVKKEYAEALKDLKAKKYPQSLRRLQDFVQKHPGTDLTDEASFKLGQAYSHQGDHFKAHRSFMSILESNMKSNYEDDARVNASSSLVQMGKFDEALQLLDKFKVKDSTSKDTASAAYQLSSKIRLQKNDATGALSDLVKALSYASPQEAGALTTRAGDIATNLNADQLERIVGDPSYKAVELPARFKLGSFYFGQKNWGAARSQYQLVVDKFPRTEQALRANEAIQSIDAQQRVDGQVIGVVLPLTGKHAQTGYKTLRGIEMGLGLFVPGGQGTTSIKLAIIDSEGNPDVARRGVDKVVSEDHAIAVIGGIPTKASRALAQRCQELGVPTIVLSQKSDITEIGPFVFQNALTAELQMPALVEAAIREKKWKRFAILYPNDAYGTEYATVFWDAVNSMGGTVVSAQSYQSDETDFRASIKKLVGTYYVDDRMMEYKLRQKEWEKKQPTKSARAKNPTDILPPIVDFDALFIADSPKAVGQIAPMLAYNDVSKIPLLGTNIWNTPQLPERASKYAEDSLFVDSYFTEDPKPSLKKFVDNFQATFGYVPDVFEADGYDSAALVYQVLKKNNFSLSRQSLQHELQTAAPVDGSTGPIKVSPRREIEKSLIALTVKNGKIVKWSNRGDAKR